MLFTIGIVDGNLRAAVFGAFNMARALKQTGFILICIPQGGEPAKALSGQMASAAQKKKKGGAHVLTSLTAGTAEKHLSNMYPSDIWFL